MPATDFHLFSPVHFAILAAVPASAWLLTRISRSHPGRTSLISGVLAAFLTVNEVIWYAYRYSTEGFRFPEGLPLQLCDVLVWLSVAALLTRAQWVFESAYLLGLGGAGMALLTPDLWAPLLSYPSIYFFLAHGAIVIALLFLVWTNSMRPEPGCIWRVMLFVNGFAAFVGAFNAIFGTNYMYLCRKPQGASLLDWFGPWPVYLLVGETFALLLFTLFWLPFRREQAS